ncbi:MAG: hypothetical protein JWQ40_5146 [Segetibacter sp.]|nr:hypothetical protein [Segetibacter sp.]
MNKKTVTFPGTKGANPSWFLHFNTAILSGIVQAYKELQNWKHRFKKTTDLVNPAFTTITSSYFSHGTNRLKRIITVIITYVFLSAIVTTQSSSVFSWLFLPGEVAIIALLISSFNQTQIFRTKPAPLPVMKIHY